MYVCIMLRVFVLLVFVLISSICVLYCVSIDSRSFEEDAVDGAVVHLMLVDWQLGGVWG